MFFQPIFEYCLCWQRQQRRESLMQQTSKGGIKTVQFYSHFTHFRQPCSFLPICFFACLCFSCLVGGAWITGANWEHLVRVIAVYKSLAAAGSLPLSPSLQAASQICCFNSFLLFCFHAHHHTHTLSPLSCTFYTTDSSDPPHTMCY